MPKTVVDKIESYDSQGNLFDEVIFNPVTVENEPEPVYKYCGENGTKLDLDKPRMELLDPGWLEEVARVMTFGAKKYADNNWRSGIRLSRLIGAAFRHLLAILRGEDIDPESGFSHSAHLSCCAMFISWHLLHRTDMDDRWVNERTLSN